MKRAVNPLVAIATSLAGKDPGPAPARLRKTWVTEVVAEEDDGTRHLHVSGRGGRGASMVRCPGRDTAPRGYPAGLPFLAGETVWWGSMGDCLFAVWVDVMDTEGVAGTVTATSVALGWDIDNAVMLPPIAGTIVLGKGNVRRIVMADSGRVTLLDTNVA